MQNNEVSICDVPVGLYQSQQELLDQLLVQNPTQSTVATAINPEKILTSEHDKQTRVALQGSHVRYADGIGVVMAVRRKTGLHIPRLPGCELWEALMSKSIGPEYKVYLLGGSETVNLQTAEKLKARYHTNIVGRQNGFFEDDVAVIEEIRSSGANIITVALGSPKQEQFIFKCIEKGIVASFMGVGGSYDVFTQSVKRAPGMWQKLGLEWLYRLVSQPSRITRQVRLFRFLWRIVINKV